jgi:hypothetical protein
LEAPVAFGILNTIGAMPQSLQDIVVNIFGLKGTAVMTNVIGPREQLYLAGAPLTSLMFWVPQSGHLGLGVSILSYNGQVWIGTITDAGLVPDPDAIIDAFQTEFNELLEEAREGLEAPVRPRPVQTARDDALALETEDSEGADTPDKAPPQCQALTKTGKQCKNRAQAGSVFCHVHQR